MPASSCNDCHRTSARYPQQLKTTQQRAIYDGNNDGKYDVDNKEHHNRESVRAGGIDAQYGQIKSALFAWPAGQLGNGEPPVRTGFPRHGGRVELAVTVEKGIQASRWTAPQ
ncbi:MAG TPA: hypothetical protein VKR55_12090 [Bradyrhizobium sp.]|uniref:hypothetical protein n=1 Tax=Bradyrhizobium sp. TaxID=376 RepID=UPI002B94B533|nr:hypothetical protein [Bradyrhizobium sp.]HLZ02879.1 hypothetical protein [Bradyrhizobium sp.]